MPTNIAWTDETWNPVHGCSKVSAGCDNCYAERISNRYGHTDHEWTAEHAEANVQLKPEKLEDPYGYDEPKRIFVNSMSDLFHSLVPEEFIREVFAVMRNEPRHIFQILTKRPGRAANMELQWPENVWMGTSVEDERVLERLDLLRPSDAETLFVSFEPLIGPVGKPDLEGFDWAIVGGESGPKDVRREMAHEWVWRIKDACKEQGVAFFFKQSSAAQPERGQALRCRDGKRREFREMPSLPESTRKAREQTVMTDGGQQEEPLPRFFTSFVQELVESPEHEVTVEPAERYGWLLHVDGENILPAGRDGMPWENFTIGSDWKDRLTDEQLEHLRSLPTKPVTERLREQAFQELQNAHEKQAMALAVEDGELTEEEALELLKLDELAVVQSEYYPGDEFYDRAASQLQRKI